LHHHCKRLDSDRSFPIHQIAEVMGISPAMVHKHYRHLRPLETAKRIPAMTNPLEKLRNRFTVDTLHKASDAYKEVQPDVAWPE
jgi:hypothetical protein